MRAFRLKVALGVAATLFAARDAAADGGAPAPIEPRVVERLDSYAALGTLEIVTGSIALAGGGALTTAGLWPCPAGNDCSTRGLGVALGGPLVITGAFLVMAGIRNRSNASSLREALEADASGATADALSQRMHDRADTELLVGVLIGVAGLGGLVTSLVMAKGCTRPCTAATAVGVAGGVVAVGGIGVATFGWADRAGSQVPLGTPVLPVTPTVSPTSLGLATSFSF